MKALVTGANGFLGRHVVAALLAQGHAVRAMVRPASSVERLPWRDEVEFFRADLRVARDLPEAFAGVDVLIHVAADMTGGSVAFAATALSTERLFAAMEEAGLKRLVQISSFSVYDWQQVRKVGDESAPLPDDLHGHPDHYAQGKIWQERLARRMEAEHGWEITFIRPGFVWGRGHEYQPCLGQKVGPLHLVYGGLRRLALTHVENCADAIVRAAEDPRAIGRTYNVVDSDDVRAGRFVRDYIRGSGEGKLAVWVPSPVFRSLVNGVGLASRLIFGERGKLPSFCRRDQWALRFKPLRYSNRALREELNWEPPLSYEECLEHTYGSGGLDG